MEVILEILRYIGRFAFGVGLVTFFDLLTYHVTRAKVPKSLFKRAAIVTIILYLSSFIYLMLVGKAQAAWGYTLVVLTVNTAIFLRDINKFIER